MPSHCSSSADVICNVLEIRSNLMLERIHGQDLNCSTRKVVFHVEQLALPTEKPMKIRGDGSLIVSRPQVKVNSRLYLLLRADILQKTVVECP